MKTTHTNIQQQLITPRVMLIVYRTQRESRPENNHEVIMLVVPTCWGKDERLWTRCTSWKRWSRWWTSAQCILQSNATSWTLVCDTRSVHNATESRPDHIKRVLRGRAEWTRNASISSTLELFLHCLTHPVSTKYVHCRKANDMILHERRVPFWQMDKLNTMESAVNICAMHVSIQYFDVSVEHSSCDAHSTHNAKPDPKKRKYRTDSAFCADVPHEQGTTVLVLQQYGPTSKKRLVIVRVSFRTLMWRLPWATLAWNFVQDFV